MLFRWPSMIWFLPFLSSFLILLVPILFFLLKPKHTCIFFFFCDIPFHLFLFFTEVSPTNTSGLHTTILQKDFLWHFLRSFCYILRWVCLPYLLLHFSSTALFSSYISPAKPQTPRRHEKHICQMNDLLLLHASIPGWCFLSAMPFISSSVLLISIQILRQSSVIFTSKPPPLVVSCTYPSLWHYLPYYNEICMDVFLSLDKFLKNKDFSSYLFLYAAP